MGDRVSISFKNGEDESVVLFSHWGGRALVEDAQMYAEELALEMIGDSSPLDRLEPDTVMVDFIRHITKDMGRVVCDFYLGKIPDDGDNSDNGHFLIDLGELQRLKLKR